MSKGIARLLPHRVMAQVVLILLVAMVTVLLFVIGAFHYTRDSEPSRNELVMRGLQGVAAASRLNRVEPEKRGALLDQLNREMPLLGMETEDALQEVDPAPKEERFPPSFWPDNDVSLGTGMSIITIRNSEAAGPERGGTSLVFTLADGSRYRIVVEEMVPPPIYGTPPFLVLEILALSSLLLLIWGMRALVRPLTRLAEAVACFGQETTEAVPVAEEGPREVQQVARAFNRMQRRIADLLDRRTRMLTAIGHDLRTPLTRLRLRIELMPDEALKQRNLADLNLMETQLEGALSFLRDGRTGEERRKLDLPTLLQTIADQYEDMGRSIPVSCPPGLVVEGRSAELVRAFGNLIDNAFRYDERVSVAAACEGGMICVDVIDHGPGIAPKDRERLLEPFERGDAARQMSESGHLGLGLATTRAIAEAHGGGLDLLETPGGGLTARLTFAQAAS
ncbi:ATP-binding protein [Roseibium sp.]|uniref:ATP-binding protein n=1 Tax=Roseibium sp. TaxID=1936156 RepID=UPI003A97C299